MEWFFDLYDDFRRRTGFGSVPESRTREEVDFICDVLRLPPGGRVLDICCGTGRHAIELATRGYSIVGIEYNHDYVRSALELSDGKNPRFIQGDVRLVDFPSRCDGAILMFNSFGYFSDEEDRALISRIHGALKPGGRFLLEILNGQRIIDNFQPHSEKEIDGVRVVETRCFDGLTKRNNFTIERCEGGRTIRKSGSWRLYSADELKSLAKDCSLEFMDGFASLEKAPLTDETRLMRLIFEKQARDS